MGKVLELTVTLELTPQPDIQEKLAELYDLLLALPASGSLGSDEVAAGNKAEVGIAI